jgi:hypothetical protein
MFSVALETQAIYISHFCSMRAHGGQKKSATLHDNCCFGQKPFDKNSSFSCSILIEVSNNGTRNVLFQQLKVNS